MSHRSLPPEDRRNFLRASLPFAAMAAGGLLPGAAAAGAMAEAPATVPNIAALRALPAPAAATIIHVAGYHAPGDGGGGTFVWTAQFRPNADSLPDDGGTCLLPQGSAPDRPGRWRRLDSGPLNVKWFGAMGDDSGKTPAGTGTDIANAPWNNHWPQWIEAQRPLHTAKFANDDSWDYIGIQLALLSVGPNVGEVMIPAGHYRLSQHLLYSGDMRATLTGAGMYQTILTKTPNSFKNSFVLRLFDTGGIPTVIRDICFRGPTDAQMQFDHAAVNFTLIAQNHTNGVHIQSCWFASCNVGIIFAGSSDCYVDHCTAEYCGTVITMDAATDLQVSNSNFWQSAPATERYTGIESAGRLHCIGNRFVGLENCSLLCKGGSLQAVGNFFFQFTHASSVIDAAEAGQSVISGNRIVGATVAAMVTAGPDTLVTGNYFEQQGDHACIDLTHDKTNINITGNVLCTRPAGTKIFEQGLISSVKPGVNFSSGCSGCLINGNTLNQPNSIAVDATRNQIDNNVMTGG
jgi:hypothetical protein